MDEYLIWSHEHGMWWRAEQRGYSMSVKDAGRYSRDEAIKICALARDGIGDLSTPPTEIPVRVDDLIECGIVFSKAGPQLGARPSQASG